MSLPGRDDRRAKGEYGYILYGRRVAILRTVLAVCACVALFLTGLIIYHSNRNLFSIAAALGSLPAGWSAVNMVMLLRSHPCSEGAHESIEAVRGGLLIYYDLNMTSYDRSYHIAAATVLERSVCLYSEDAGIVPAECEKHVREQLALGGYSPDWTASVRGCHSWSAPAPPGA